MLALERFISTRPSAYLLAPVPFLGNRPLGEQVENLERGLERLEHAIEAGLPEGGPPNLDRLIDDLYSLEISVHRGASGQRVETNEGLREAAMACDDEMQSPELHQERQTLIERTLTALRDCRWQLMALRADLERDQETAEFTDAASLQTYLDQLKA